MVVEWPVTHVDTWINQWEIRILFIIILYMCGEWAVGP